jgi:hypothetical protein
MFSALWSCAWLLLSTLIIPAAVWHSASSCSEGGKLNVQSNPPSRCVVGHPRGPADDGASPSFPMRPRNGPVIAAWVSVVSWTKPPIFGKSRRLHQGNDIGD